jgi:hypothetical protein
MHLQIQFTLPITWNARLSESCSHSYTTHPPVYILLRTISADAQELRELNFRELVLLSARGRIHKGAGGATAPSKVQNNS